MTAHPLNAMRSPDHSRHASSAENSRVEMGGKIREVDEIKKKNAQSPNWSQAEIACLDEICRKNPKMKAKELAVELYERFGTMRTEAAVSVKLSRTQQVPAVVLDTRKCMVCRAEFVREHKSNHICPKCSNSEVFRSGDGFAVIY